MKHLLPSLLVLALAATGCKTEKPAQNKGGDEQLSGRWRHNEQLADPGDGSGNWQPVVYVRAAYLTLGADGSANADGIAGFAPVTRYEKLNDSTLRFTRSAGSQFDARYRVSGGQLELRYTCIEACGDRFAKE
ncbi:MAG: hypothetical protein EOO16_13725 [Chitinophagaceae bacterium]|nr:MAG: hypothetical protein EOO16_13725 [Chitinophagaceae bacterium]